LARSMKRLRALYLAYLSGPAEDRPVYRAIRRHRVRRILELGIGTGHRSRRMIELAGLRHSPPEIEFCGIDLFESRSAADGPGMSLKMAHRLLGSTAAHVRLVPAAPDAGLSQAANGLGQVDLLVVSARLDPESLARAWFYVPRLLHDGTCVFQERLPAGGRCSVHRLTGDEIHALARAAVLRRAA
jgi:hypothetical protein